LPSGIEISFLWLPPEVVARVQLRLCVKKALVFAVSEKKFEVLEFLVNPEA
jgi:hypothetical protein